MDFEDCCCKRKEGICTALPTGTKKGHQLSYKTHLTARTGEQQLLGLQLQCMYVRAENQALRRNSKSVTNHPNSSLPAKQRRMGIEKSQARIRQSFVARKYDSCET